MPETQPLFGTDGIRGTTNDHASPDEIRLTPELALRVGRVLGDYAASRVTDGTRPLVVLGRDTRLSGVMLETALCAGFLAQGVDVIQLGVVPTPAVAYLVCRSRAQLGVAISASHNPADDNGIKVFEDTGYKLQDDAASVLEARILAPDCTLALQNTAKLGQLLSGEALVRTYVEELIAEFPDRAGLAGKTVVLECAHGAASALAPEVFRVLGAEVVVLNGEPDGLNINTSYEYIEPVSLARHVVATGADFGVAFDGDADRVILVDEGGHIYDGDEILSIIAHTMKRRGELPNDGVVTTNMSNLGLKIGLREIGVEVLETPVGDKYVLAAMLERGYILGGERAGHVIVLDGKRTTGDAIFLAAWIATELANVPGGKLSSFRSLIRRFPQFIGSAVVPASKPPLATVRGLDAEVAGIRAALGPETDVNLRYSGTENKVRLSIRTGQPVDGDLVTQVGKRALDAVAGHIRTAAG